ncbi:SMP-30/gluconolactonase/LRE family protein [Pseudonocardia sp. GCM10023141]|uniref:SMP-30/gluconolactonase/LRE family protein n=1 Tax=Pseudonocardia sp. GCM10023141 TaxID=3252653 RepID=UPI0036073000
MSDGRVFATATDDVGRFDNIRFDDGGRLWVAATSGGVPCYDPDGSLIGRLRVPEAVSNIAFGGPKNNRMHITATSGLYSLVKAGDRRTPNPSGRRMSTAPVRSPRFPAPARHGC